MMVKTKRAVLIPIWVAFMATALLLALLLRTAPVSAPTFSLQQLVTGPAAGMSQTSHTVNQSGSTSFDSSSTGQQTSDQGQAPQGSAECPSKPGVSLACTQQR